MIGVPLHNTPYDILLPGISRLAFLDNAHVTELLDDFRSVILDADGSPIERSNAQLLEAAKEAHSHLHQRIHEDKSDPSVRIQNTERASPSAAVLWGSHAVM